MDKINHVCNKECGGLCCTKIEGFQVSFGSTSILKDVNLHIHCGELTAIIGPNGAGKSTLLQAMLGQIKHGGELKFMDAKGAHNGKPVIGYVPQYLSFDSGTPTSVLDLFMVSKSRIPAWLFTTKKLKKGITQSLSMVKAEHLINRKIGELSGGELQRVLLALALDPVPDLLLLDEPVSGIDQNGLELFYNIVSEIRDKYDLSIILISHDLELVEKYADRVVLLNGTVLCSGTPAEVFNNENTKRLFGSVWFKNRSEGQEGEGDA